MPPKVKVTKEDIIKTAVDLVRAGGVQSVNSRAIAAALCCSTQPIFSNFSSMEELERSVIDSAFASYLGYLQRESDSGKYPEYKAFGMAYVRFAKEEKELFKLLFMRDRSGEEITSSADAETSAKMIMQANGVSIETARLMHLELWTCVHGIGVMLATSFQSLEWDLISQILTDVYQGIRHRHVSEAKQNDSH